MGGATFGGMSSWSCCPPLMGTPVMLGGLTVHSQEMSPLEFGSVLVAALRTTRSPPSAVTGVPVMTAMGFPFATGTWTDTGALWRPEGSCTTRLKRSSVSEFGAVSVGVAAFGVPLFGIITGGPAS